MKSTFRSVSMALLLSILLVVPAAHVIGFSSGFSRNADSTLSSIVALSLNRVFLNQTFDGAASGKIPDEWHVTYPQYGNFTADGTGYDGKGKCAMIVDNSTKGNPSPYRYFAQQTNTIAVSFAIKPTNNSASNTTLEVFVDDGNFNGANIIFKEGKIGYRRKDGSFFELHSSYVPDRWYRIKLILNVPRNVYNIHIDDHLEAVSAEFFGSGTQLHRIIFNETSGYDGLLLPVAYIDEVFGRQGIEIPRDYATIQAGIDAANESDLVFVTGQRTYYEHIVITKSIDLVGEDMRTTIIDGSLETPKSGVDGVFIQTKSVEMNGFTVRSTPYGAGIRVQGSDNHIANNNVTNGLGDGINVVGSLNVLASNIITSNLRYGVQISGSNSTLTDNTIASNDACGVLISGSNSTITDNFIASNLDCGVLMANGDNNLMRNNTVRKNRLGVKCEVGTLSNRIYQNRFIGNDQKPQAADYGTNNTWDDGYPYNPDNKTGGGNYWSDFDCFDMYKGVNQDEHGRCCSPSPDGISDRPYNLSLQVQDKYPLFVLQNVTQNPENDIKCGINVVVNIEYNVSVLVNATLLRNVTIAGAFILVDYDSSHENITMKKSGDIWQGSIPPKKYGTLVRYNISVHAELAVEVNTTNYQLDGAYFVGDKTPPTIDNVVWSPSVPDDNQTIRVWAHVTEPANASGVGGVSLSYLFNDTVWTASMLKTTNDNYTALMPRQPGSARLFFNVSAVDSAGNRISRSSSTLVNRLPELSVTNATHPRATVDPCTIDLGVMYRGEKRTDNNLTLYNIGQENLAWNITLVADGNWLNWPVLPSSGTLRPGNSTTIAISVDTTSCLDPDLYVAELSVNANGTVSRWVVIVRLIVRDIVIDDSWCSKPAPQRSNVDQTQQFAFHAKWTHNCTEAVSGRIRVNDTTIGDSGWLSINGTGWVNFPYNSLNPIQNTFTVVAVDVNYIDHTQLYHIRSFTQKAAPLTTIWDRVSVVLRITDACGPAIERDARIDAGSIVDITWTDSVYAFDNTPFQGTPSFNDTLIKDVVGRYCITTAGVIDTKYGLTAFQSNSVYCIWDRIKIIGGGTTGTQTYVGKMARVWLIAVYEYDNMLLKTANGTLFMNVYEFNMTTQSWQPAITDDEMDWSTLFDRWEKSFSFDTQGSRRFVVSKVRDNLHCLTVTRDLVGPQDITWLGGGWAPWYTWGTSSDSANASSDGQPVPVQGALEVPFWAITGIALTLVIGMVLILIVLVTSRKRRLAKGTNNHSKSRLSK